MDKEQIYSKCGFYCNRCPAFKDNSRTEADRERGSALWEKYFGLHFKSEIVRCEGCQATAPWQTGNRLPDRSCPIRACAVYNGAVTCAHCSLFPCEEYTKRVPGADLRRQRESAANTKFSDDEYLDYLEPFDGQTHLKKLHITLRPEDIVPAKQISASERIIPFPRKTNLPFDKEQEMRQLHSLLGTAFSQQAANYAGQVLIERKKPYLWGILWVMGLYGELGAEKLVLESAVCGDRKECSRLVRKRDNTLYEPVQDAVNSLKKSGIQIEFKPSKKNWTLTLSVDESVRGSSIPQSLKAYISNLVKKYGEPVYVSSYNLKGKAFKFFTMADMSDL
jgi:hypothetical protein